MILESTRYTQKDCWFSIIVAFEGVKHPFDEDDGERKEHQRTDLLRMTLSKDLSLLSA